MGIMKNTNNIDWPVSRFITPAFSGNMPERVFEYNTQRFVIPAKADNPSDLPDGEWVRVCKFLLKDDGEPTEAFWEYIALLCSDEKGMIRFLN